MSAKIRSVDYFYMTVPDKPGAACSVLFQLAAADVNLLAFSAVPIGPENTQLVLFPENVDALARGAENAGFVLSGPSRAFLIQGDDKLGALVSIHEKLSDSGINVYASTGVSDGKGGFGYVMYVKGDRFDEAARVLNV
jgi:hypothetical protein